MIKLKKVWCIIKSEYIKSLLDARNIVILAMYIVMYDNILKEFIKLSRKMKEPIGIVEPFKALSGTGLVVIMLPLVFLVLASDFPKINGNVRFYIMRVGKFKWLMGQLGYAVLMIVTYIGITFAASCILAAPYSYVGNSWSNVVTKYYIAFPEEADSMANRLIHETLYNQTTPYMALLHSVLLYGLFMLLICVILLVAFVYAGRKNGLYAASLFVLAGGVFSVLGNKTMWLFPAAHTMVWKHYNLILRDRIMPIQASYLYFGILIVIGLLLVCTGIKNKDFDEVENGD